MQHPLPATNFLLKTGEINKAPAGSLGHSIESTPGAFPSNFTSGVLFQIVSQATAAANKFRQAPVTLRHASVFGEIVRKSVQNPPELEEQSKKHDKLKSQLSNVQAKDSGHKHRW